MDAKAEDSTGRVPAAKQKQGVRQREGIDKERSEQPSPAAQAEKQRPIPMSDAVLDGNRFDSRDWLKV